MDQTTTLKVRSLNSIDSARGPRLVSGPDAFIESLPFTPGDVTAGTENELQAYVAGKRSTVDLPTFIERSRYYSNIARRVASGETGHELLREIQTFLSHNDHEVWDNSWVRFPRRNLSAFANELLDQDLEVDGQQRKDRDKFVFATSWGEWIRIPISYLVKLALADVVGRQPEMPSAIKSTVTRLLPYFSNDLTSPETSSFYLVKSSREASLGTSIAGEMSLRFLLTHLLVEWANKVIDLEAVGQRAAVNFAPHPPVRQRELNNCISDAFYRELFVSPCLSGWTNGEAKHQYMLLAHQITSRSQINAVAKLREAGIIANNLVVLPNTSSVSLANNGTHLSLGSRKLTAHLSDPDSSFTTRDAKWIGDLVIKICEHFLPLFVGTYTAAPYRLGFHDLHPERALGFLPHELDYTHLRMLWRHWKSKPHLRIFGHAITPYGPRWIDQIVARLLRRRGDLIPDFRLIDFPVAWLCTESASALDGEMGNASRFKQDLDTMGVSDRNLKLYLPFSLREVREAGYFGFEGRHYSLFESMTEDFAPAADLQQLITVLAYKYAISGAYAHSQLPDDPSSESERRLPFFCAALGLDAFNVRVNTPNDFMRRIVSLAKDSSPSQHKGYRRLSLAEYRLALLRVIEEDARDCIELLGVDSMISDLRSRLQGPDLTAYGKLMKRILRTCGTTNALAIEAREFNLAAEHVYRNELKQKHLREGLDFIRRSLNNHSGISVRHVLGDLRADHFLNEIENSLLADRLKPAQLQALINIALSIVAGESGHTDGNSGLEAQVSYESSIHRPAYATSM